MVGCGVGFPESKGCSSILRPKPLAFGGGADCSEEVVCSGVGLDDCVPAFFAFNCANLSLALRLASSLFRSVDLSPIFGLLSSLVGWLVPLKGLLLPDIVLLCVANRELGNGLL
ncbi:hypothetical protein WICPIJ_008167 [Wickerhamomyces pijperi]|uniref:Uncharacterized protein n=1 Tax=Wickerhamomyces pijperi TaxID=599730 RepID=A0A9P8Q037_WICPI|nr:hypothetical protein WICPIJ_008167 [Wickerhamomyces pijperi]